MVKNKISYRKESLKIAGSRIASIIPLLVAITAVSVLCLSIIYGSFFNLNIFADGYFFHILIHGNEPTPLYLNTYYNLFHYIGRIFGHSLLGYRLLALFMLFGSTLLLANSAFRYSYNSDKHKKTSTFNDQKQTIFACALLIQMFFYYTHILKTLSYYTISSVASYLWPAFLLLYLTRKNESSGRIHICLLSICALLAFTARPASGLALVVCIPSAIALHNRFIQKDSATNKNILLFAYVSFSVFAVYCAATFHLLRHFPDLYKASFKSHHQNMFFQYLSDLLSALRNWKSMIAACTFIVLAEKLKTPGFEQEKPGTHSMPRTKIDSWKKQAARKISKILSHSAVCTSIISACAAYLLYKIWAFYCATSTQKDFGFFIKLTEFFRFGFAVYGAILVTSAVTWWKALVRTNTTATEFSQIYKRRLFLCVVCVCSCAISILGTACCISDMVLYSMAVFSLPIIVAITDITSLFSKNLFVYYVFCAISFFFVFPRIAVFQTLNNRHPFPTAKSKNSSFLKFVSVRQEFADSVDSLISTLEKVGFDFEKDRIVASYLAGYVCASGAKTLGNPFQFYFEGMPESFDMFSCAFLKLELGKNIRKVYLLLSEKEPLGKSVQNMLHKFLTADRKFKSLYIGIGPSNTMIEDGSKLYLMGPYTFNKNTQR